MKNTTVLLLVIIILGFWFLAGAMFVENFDLPCGGLKQSHDMCSLMAGANCRIPTWQLSDCWLNAYRKCSDECGEPNGNCQCYTRATEMCRSRDDPAEACFQSTYQKCMSGRVPGFPDPDR